jgi:anti-anti-sigma regulatory factor
MFTKETETRLRRVGKAAIIDLIGDVTNRGQEAIVSAYAGALESPAERIFFNFGETEYINTSGIAVLISVVIEAEKAGRKIGLYGMSAHYYKVFNLVRLPLYADVYESEAEALASVQSV